MIAYAHALQVVWVAEVPDPTYWRATMLVGQKHEGVAGGDEELPLLFRQMKSYARQ